MYYIGIDGGGTKTEFGLFDSQGKQIDSLKKETSHYLQVGFDGCAQCLFQGIQELVDLHQLHSQQVYIGIGLAGYGNDEIVKKQLDEAIDKVLKDYHYVVTSDVHIALLGALNGEDGIVVISGTGSIAIGKVGDQLIRTGGWGYQIGDEGSAYWIGKELLRIFSWQADGRIKKDEIYDIFMERYQLENPYQIISIISHLENPRSEIAALARICSQLSSTNQHCYQIIKEAAKYISLLVDGLKKYLRGQPLVSYYGGVFQDNTFLKYFKEYVSDCRIIEPQYNALYGAYLLAKDDFE